jgi:hypothetical protein
VALTCHDNACEQSYSLAYFVFHHFPLIKMNEESLVEKFKRIVREKEKMRMAR